jgi:hypothetical protein
MNNILTRKGCAFTRFELDYILAALKKPYIAVLDGLTSMYQYCSSYVNRLAHLDS